MHTNKISKRGLIIVCGKCRYDSIVADNDVRIGHKDQAGFDCQICGEFVPLNKETLKLIHEKSLSTESETTFSTLFKKLSPPAAIAVI